MDYEKKYKEALCWMRSVYPTMTGTVKEDAEHFFPELKESGDERIVKELLTFFRESIHGGHILTNKEYDSWIAWLEKQGEQKSIVEMKSPEESLGIDSDTYNKIVDECIYGEQKPVDKVEPKFHEGEWVVYECGEETATLQITRIVGETYVFSDDSTLSVADENTLRLWDITKDAKAGDVLADGNLPFIFKKIDANKYSYAYCGISVDDGFKIESDGGSGEWTWMQDIKPATKEQRDLLFQKMREAGYEWLEETKELKKIEQTHAWSEKGAKWNDREIPFSEQEPYEGLTDFERTLADICIGWIGQELGWKQYIKDNADVLLKIAIKKFNSVQDAPFEQKPAEWSEEEIRTIFDDYIGGRDTYTSCINRLKSLRPQPKQDWSEEDKVWIDRACMLLDDFTEYIKQAIKDE